nr:sugar ABC transporter ATP-binding protein [Neobacillus sp. Marseille-Q6967]
MEDILSVQGVNKHFAKVKALDNIQFNLKRGEIHALVGHNGAGKSTFVKVLTGTYIPDGGTIKLENKEVVFRGTQDAINQGIGIVTQEGSLIPSFNAIENIFLGQEETRGGFINRRKLVSKAKSLMKTLGIELDLYKQVKDLNPAQRKLIEVLKILNINPKILILDEPTAALSENERVKLFSVMRKLKNDGISIIFITHYLDEVFEMSDRITVLRNGTHAGTRFTEKSSNDEIVKLMIDKDHHSEYPDKNHELGSVLFEVKNVSDGLKITDANLSIRRGEIVGVFGTVGSGRTELAECIFGARDRKSGSLILDGNELKNRKSVPKSIENGLVLIPDDRLKKSLILDDPVKYNLTLPFLGEISPLSWIQFKSEEKKSQSIVKELNIKTPTINEKVKNLSGGNKQKVSFGKWMLSKDKKPKVFIFDEPTEGVDVGARAEMYKIMVDLASEGAGILLISSDISEIKGLSDRIYIMKEGSIVDEVQNVDITNERLIQSSLGV